MYDLINSKILVYTILIEFIIDVYHGIATPLRQTTPLWLDWTEWMNHPDNNLLSWHLNM